LLLALISTVVLGSGLSGPMTKFLFAPRPFMCLEMQPPLRQEEGVGLSE
jgi:hypothetical protein